MVGVKVTSPRRAVLSVDPGITLWPASSDFEKNNFEKAGGYSRHPEGDLPRSLLRQQRRRLQELRR